MDPCSGKSVVEKGIVSRVVNDLTRPFSGSNLYFIWIIFLPVVLELNSL